VDNNELSDDILEIWVGGSDDIVAESRRSYTKLSPSMFPEKDIYEEFPIEITYEGEEEMEYIIEALP